MSPLPRAYAHRPESVAFTAAVSMPLLRQLIRPFRLNMVTPAYVIWRICRSVSERIAAQVQALPPTAFSLSKRLINWVGAELRTDSTYTAAHGNNLGASQTRL